MAVDKLVDSAQLDADLTSVANAIRTKGGTSAQLAFPADFVSAINAISGGGSVQFKSGTYTPAQDYTDTVKHEIVSLATIGFTPSVFVFRCNDKDAISGTKFESVYLVSDTRWPLRLCTYYSNTSNSVACLSSQTSWTGERNGHLYCDGTKVYVKTAVSTAYLKGGAEYIWEAYA